MRYLIGLMAGALLAGATQLRADETRTIPSISTSGDSVVYVSPDLVTVSFGIQTFNRDLDKAKQKNDRAGEQLLQAITALDVKREEIQTNKLSVVIRYPDGNPWDNIEGYLVQRRYAVKLKDVKKFESLIDTALKNGANQILGIDFQSSELRKFRDQARKMAIQAAKEKATSLAKELNCTVGLPRMISDGGVGYFGNYGGMQNGFQQMSQNSASVEAAGNGEDAGSLPLGQIGIHAQLNVTFDLSTK